MATILHGGILLSLVVSVDHAAPPSSTPPSMAVELVSLPPSPVPQPHISALSAAPRPRVEPPTPLDRIDAPPVSAEADLHLPPPRPVQPPRPSPPPGPPTPPQLAETAVQKAAVDRLASAEDGDPRAAAAWQSEVIARLEAAKRYPASARFAHEEATLVVRFVVDRAGKIRDRRLVGQSRFDDLADEVLDLLHRVRLPPPPASIEDRDLALTVPIEFSFRQAAR
ncbi:protein TonB [Sphingomonas endophytica]|uniref:Protein TonB n=1 Tax=Sphingomonas endophytica TaxID=869719 RepID=A0ABR6N6J0_9SPHN|nr:protein TonB [Sphingomonas endophytica]